MPPFCYKVHESEEDTILAVSDRDIVGETYSEGGRRLEVSEDFYCGEEGDREDVRTRIPDATIINATGEDSVGLMIEAGIIDEDRVIEIDGVPHAQMILLE